MPTNKCVECGEEAYKAGFLKEGEEIPITTITSKGPLCDDCREDKQGKKSN